MPTQTTRGYASPVTVADASPATGAAESSSMDFMEVINSAAGQVICTAT